MSQTDGEMDNVTESSFENPVANQEDPIPDKSEFDHVYEYSKNSPGFGEDGASPVDMAFVKWLPDQDDWIAKTHISHTQAYLIPQWIVHLESDEEFEHLVEPTKKILALYLKALTSVQGMSRTEYVDTLKSAGSGGTLSEGVYGAVKDKISRQR